MPAWRTRIPSRPKRPGYRPPSMPVAPRQPASIPRKFFEGMSKNAQASGFTKAGGFVADASSLLRSPTMVPTETHFGGARLSQADQSVEPGAERRDGARARLTEPVTDGS